MVTLDEGGRGRSGLRVWDPPAALAGCCELGWIQEPVGGPARAAPSPAGWRIVPDAHPHLVVSRHRDGGTRAVLVGARSVFVDADHHTRTFTVGVRLRPGALALLAPGVAPELRNWGALLDQVLDGPARALAGRLGGTRDARGALALLWRLVEAGAGAGAGPDWRIRGLLRAAARRPGATVGEAADQMGVSPRTLRKVFRTRVGLTPKTAHRIIRLHGALGLLVDEPGLEGSRVAAASGYADQSHLIRECRDLVGETPQAFRARGRPSREDGDSPPGGRAGSGDRTLL